MIDKYLEQTPKHKINFYDWKTISGLSNEEASTIWMDNIEKITKIKNPNENIYWKNRKSEYQGE